jgi:hypothetical protein
MCCNRTEPSPNSSSVTLSRHLASPSPVLSLVEKGKWCLFGGRVDKWQKVLASQKLYDCSIMVASFSFPNTHRAQIPSIIFRKSWGRLLIIPKPKEIGRLTKTKQAKATQSSKKEEHGKCDVSVRYCPSKGCPGTWFQSHSRLWNWWGKYFQIHLTREEMEVRKYIQLLMAALCPVPSTFPWCPGHEPVTLKQWP